MLKLRALVATNIHLGHISVQQASYDSFIHSFHKYVLSMYYVQLLFFLKTPWVDL